MVEKFFFEDLEAESKIDATSKMNKESLWYCFSAMLQADCNAVKEHWNTHYIRRSRHNTVKGRPDSLFTFYFIFFFARISRCHEQSFVKCGTQ